MAVKEFFSIDIAARAFSLSWFIVDLRKVLILFNVEKQRSGSDVVIGIVKRIVKSFVISHKTQFKLFSKINFNKSINLQYPCISDLL